MGEMEIQQGKQLNEEGVEKMKKQQIAQYKIVNEKLESNT